MNLEPEFQRARQALLSTGRRGYQSIIQFSQIALSQGQLIVNCLTEDDADALMQTFGEDLHRIVQQQLPQIATIEIQAEGKTIYPPHPPGCLFWA
ncbi:hypothetical protein IQ249_19765 [Lusitaniella coriacea LEGE 07157]|uniref:Uncharacterized protein n=1 Tax=Lusitaniella coriacea LEGE 07157 TaxID=945747 RepID=A0A8J7JD84_9CYAN|nr:hypothetical protein [Lusitaniella coriacea]MBE9118135.1 hypothetical protein [Lusitaniella coriacea LEGE 07157]